MLGVNRYEDYSYSPTPALTGTANADALAIGKDNQGALRAASNYVLQRLGGLFDYNDGGLTNPFDFQNTANAAPTTGTTGTAAKTGTGNAVPTGYNAYNNIPYSALNPGIANMAATGNAPAAAGNNGVTTGTDGSQITIPKNKEELERLMTQKQKEADEKQDKVGMIFFQMPKEDKDILKDLKGSAAEEAKRTTNLGEGKADPNVVFLNKVMDHKKFKGNKALVAASQELIKTLKEVNKLEEAYEKMRNITPSLQDEVTAGNGAANGATTGNSVATGNSAATKTAA